MDPNAEMPAGQAGGKSIQRRLRPHGSRTSQQEVIQKAKNSDESPRDKLHKLSHGHTEKPYQRDVAVLQVTGYIGEGFLVGRKTKGNNPKLLGLTPSNRACANAFLALTSSLRPQDPLQRELLL